MGTVLKCDACGEPHEIEYYDLFNPPSCSKCSSPLPTPPDSAPSPADRTPTPPPTPAPLAADPAESRSEAAPEAPTAATAPSPQPPTVPVAALAEPPPAPHEPAPEAKAPSPHPTPAGPTASSAEPPEVTQAASNPRSLFGPQGRDGQPSFVLLGPLGQDAMGALYRAYDRGGARYFAVRFMAGQAGEAQTALIEREVEKLIALPHPHILHVQGSGRRQNRLYIAMDLVLGQPLARADIKDIRRIAAIFRDAASAVHYAHEEGILHGDLNPENLLVAREKDSDHAYVKDFELAHLLETIARETSSKQAGLMIRNPSYLAPEQAKETQRTPSVPGDVYGLGAALYAALTGCPPFEGPDAGKVLERLVMEEPAALERLRPEVPKPLAAIVRRAMAKEPAHRFAAAQDMADALDRFLKGVTLAAEVERFQPLAAAKPAPRPAAKAVLSRPRSGARWAVAGIGLALAFAALALGLKLLARPAPTGPPVALPEPEPDGQVELQVEPAPTEVRIDGRSVDLGEKTLTLRPGPHRVEILFGDAHREDRSVKVDPGQSQRIELRAHREIARKREERGQWAEAERLYQEALPRAADADEGRQIEQLLARARRKRVEAESVLRVESEPPGATVVIDGTTVGRTPLELKGVESGPHALEIRQEGYLPESRRVEYEAGKTEPVRVELKLRTGKIRIKDLKAGDRVRLLGKGGEETRRAEVAAAGDVELDGVRVGVCEVVVERPAHGDGRAKVVVEEGRVSEVPAFVLKELPGTLVVESDPGGAEVHLEGRSAGRTPLRLTAVAPGPKKIKLAHPERSDWEGEVRVLAAETAELKVALPPLGKLTVEAHPEGARVSGAVNGVTRAEGRLKAGEAQVRIVHPEAGEVERRFHIRSGEETTESVDLWAERGKELEKAGKLEEAAKAYQRARGESRDKPLQRLYEVWISRADEFLRAKEWIQAREAAGQALKLKPADARARDASSAARYEEAIARAEDFARTREWKKTREAAQAALTARPRDARALVLSRTASYEEAMTRAREREKAGQWEEARQAYEEALLARPATREASEAIERLSWLAWREVRFFDGYAFCVAFGPSGKILAAGRLDKTVHLWDTETGRTVRTLSGHSGSVASVAFSPEGKWLASSSVDGAVKVWEVETGNEVSTLRGHSGEVWSVAFSPDGKLLASGGEDRTIRLWEAGPWRAVRTLSGHSGSVSSVAFSPDGKRLASSSGDKTVKLWRVERGVELQTLKGHSGYVSQVVFGPDGKALASASGDKTIKLWDLEGGKEPRSLSGHANNVSQTAFFSGGRLLASASGDRTIRLWDVEAGEERRLVSGHTAEIWSVAFARDATLMASGGSDGVRLWALRR